jgi:uncharacterized membrane protein YhaH (DUF805 family)
MFEALRHYADFSGRSRRRDFWLFILFQWLVYIGLMLLMVSIGVSLSDMSRDSLDDAAIGVAAIIILVVMILFWLAMLVPSLAVAARRMQDQNIPGWVGILLVITGWIFWPIPFIIMAVFGFLPGTTGPNQYGPDPRSDVNADIFG